MTMGDEELYLRECLASLQRLYQAAAKPLVDRLVAIEMRKPSPPIFITMEQAKALGFPIARSDEHA